MPPLRPRLSRLSVQLGCLRRQISVTARLRHDRSPLYQALSDLQKHAAPFVNISRLQLALRGVEQGPGNETIRVAIIGLRTARAKQLVKLFLADPLGREEEWERALAATDKPALLRIGSSVSHNRVIEEFSVNPPHLRDSRLELLVFDTNEIDLNSESILVPTIDIPTSSTRFTPIATPVHKALIVGDGLDGASLLGQRSEEIHAVVNLSKLIESPQLVDLDLAERGLQAFRQSVENALTFEHDWTNSGMPEVSEWLRSGQQSTGMKPPVRSLISSVLDQTTAEIEAEKARRLSASLSRVSHSDLHQLRQNLSRWAEGAHTELRDQLDVAFEGSRWRKLGWWKLFWRVDDVSMISTDIISQRFLIDAEKELIYLVGKIDGAGVLETESPIVDAPEQAEDEGYSPPVTLGELVAKPKDTDPVLFKDHDWPIDIHVTRTFLTSMTVPALQALAQKLVVQTLSTSSFVSALGGLMYVSSFSGIYETGAVVTFGIMWSLKRLQSKWETAREFWEGEVREEGRKAIRSVEGIVSNILSDPEVDSSITKELEEAENAVEKAREALESTK